MYKGKNTNLVNRKLLALVLTIVIWMLLPTACGVNVDEMEIGGEFQRFTRYETQFTDVLDTLTLLIMYCPSEREFEEYSEKVYELMLSYHKYFDIYNEYDNINNIKTINDNAGVAPVEVSQEIIDIINYGKEVERLTEGNVNIAFGSVISVWHDYREVGSANPEEAQIPREDELLEANMHVSIGDVIVDEEAMTVYLLEEGMSLDVGAIAKGYVIEKVADLLQDEIGVEAFLISGGGNVKAVGVKPDGTNWAVGVENPDKSQDAEPVIASVSLENISAVTSGDYQRYYTVDGKNYHHIIDPATLMPAEMLQGVTVVCEDSALADALSTGSFVMGYDKSIEIISGMEGVEAFYVLNDGTVQMTEGFADLIIK